MGGEEAKSVNSKGDVVNQNPVKRRSQGIHAKPRMPAVCRAQNQAQHVHTCDLAAYPSNPVPYPSLKAITHQPQLQTSCFLVQ